MCSERNALIEANMDLVDRALGNLLRGDNDRFSTVAEDMQGAGYLALVEAAELPEVVESDLKPFNRPYAYVMIRRAMLREAQELLDLDKSFLEQYQFVNIEEIHDLIDSDTEARILRVVDWERALAEIRGER